MKRHGVVTSTRVVYQQSHTEAHAVPHCPRHLAVNVESFIAGGEPSSIKPISVAGAYPATGEDPVVVGGAIAVLWFTARDARQVTGEFDALANNQTALPASYVKAALAMRVVAEERVYVPRRHVFIAIVQ